MKSLLLKTGMFVGDVQQGKMQGCFMCLVLKHKLLQNEKRGCSLMPCLQSGFSSGQAKCPKEGGCKAQHASIPYVNRVAWHSHGISSHQWPAWAIPCKGAALEIRQQHSPRMIQMGHMAMPRRCAQQQLSPPLQVADNRRKQQGPVHHSNHQSLHGVPSAHVIMKVPGCDMAAVDSLKDGCCAAEAVISAA